MERVVVVVFILDILGVNYWIVWVLSKNFLYVKIFVCVYDVEYGLNFERVGVMVVSC